MNKFIFLIALVPGLIFLSSCSKSGDTAKPPGAESGEQSSACRPQYSATDTTLQMATAFNEYRVRCNPSEEQLSLDLKALN